MDRLVNYAFLLLLVFLFVLDAGAEIRMRIGIALAAAALFSFLAFIFKWLTLDGVAAAIVFGTLILGLGGWALAAIVVLFFVSSTLLTMNSIVTIEEVRQAYAERKRRDGLQVWANGFWISLCVILASIYDLDFFLIGAAGAISAATADTWATEIGNRKLKWNTYLITNFKPVQAGTDGGVSMRGTLAALLGSLMIAGASALMLPIAFPLKVLLSVFLAGFSGCFADSYLGATLQQDDKTVSFSSEESAFAFSLNNNFVNWVATGFGSLAAITIHLISL